MDAVIQKDKTGCGFASVAMLAGVSYSEVKALAHRLGIQAEDDALYSDTAYVRTLLHEYQIAVSEKKQPFVSWATLPPRALLSIKFKEISGKRYWHWVVFCRAGNQAYVLDPSPNIMQPVRTDFGRMKPKWSLAVQSRKRGRGVLTQNKPG